MSRKQELEDIRSSVTYLLRTSNAFIWWDNDKQKLMISIGELGSDDDITLYSEGD